MEKMVAEVIGRPCVSAAAAPALPTFASVFNPARATDRVGPPARGATNTAVAPAATSAVMLDCCHSSLQPLQCQISIPADTGPPLDAGLAIDPII